MVPGCRARLLGMALVLLFAAVPLAPSRAASMSLGWGGFPAELTVQATQSVSDVLQPTTVPWSDSHVVESAGDRSEASYVLTADRLDVTLDQVNAANYSSLSLATSGFRFTVDQAVNARFEGRFDVSGSARRVYQRVILRKVGIVTPTEDIFVRAQESRSTADESFILGLQEGDFSNQAVGGRFTLLEPGTQYMLIYHGFMQVLDAAGAAGPATATGSFSMILPEPGTGLLTALGLLCTLRLDRRCGRDA